MRTDNAILQAMRSWRTASVSMLSFSSGLPLALVGTSIPYWLRKSGVDITTIGMISLAQAPWTFKMLWAPFLDRYRLPFGGRRRGWIVLSQLLLFLTTLGLAISGDHPQMIWLIGGLAFLMAFLGATQDIVIDAYAVDVLRKEEQGVAVGARVALWRAAYAVGGGAAITISDLTGWPIVFAAVALMYLPMIWVSFKAPEPELDIRAPQTIKEAVWEPLLGALSRHRAVEILLFVILYKLADNLSGSLLRPFLVDMQYSALDAGVAITTVGLAFTLSGTALGGALTTVIGLGHALWIFGFLQIASNVGYVLITYDPGNRWFLYLAMSFENLTQGMATGAFMVFLLRLTQKRFSATQYALFSSLFAIPRVFAGPISGIMIDSLGWRLFFWITIVAGIPGLLLLQRFSPLGKREPVFHVEQGSHARIYRRNEIRFWSFLGGISSFAFGLVFTACMRVLSAKRPTLAIDQIWRELDSILSPHTLVAWVPLIANLVFAIVMGLSVAAVLYSKNGPRLSFPERRE